jgi:hypothetical protein
MRKVVNQGGEFPENWELEFERLMRIKEQKFVNQDLHHEKSVAKKREKRMVLLEKRIEKENERIRLEG